MTGHSVLRLIALLPILVAQSGQPQVRSDPHYAVVTLCELSLRHRKASPKFISVDAEFVSAIPHGLFLTDERCPRRGLQIDFPSTGLDPSVALINEHLLEIHRANGTFRGMLKIDRSTGRPYLWLESVANFQCSDCLPEFHRDEPIHLPESPLPKWPPSL
jgi:hypothetical protein